MKLLFETVSGKKVLKEFENGSLAKNFIVKNKDKLSKATIMEGPLGSGGWTPKKAYNNFKKGRENKKELRDTIRVKDSFNKDMQDYICDILGTITKKENMANTYGCGFDKHGIYICGGWFEIPNTREIDDIDAGVSRRISFDSEKYEEKIYLPKLTQYVKEHKSLPSEKQLRHYLEAMIDKRYSINNAKQRAKKPTRLMSKTDVEDF